jgi:pimeloyl-ACP methyl ester carboxylesterase
MTPEARQAPSRHGYREEVIPFCAGDGFPCNLIHLWADQPPQKGPILLVHGAGVRANIFRAPVETTIVDFLIANGYDVWLENWRASIDFPPNSWTLDQAALYDHPTAVKTVVKQTGCDTIKALIHCQGSTSFMMAASAGLVPQVTTILSNAVSLHPVVPAFSRFKLQVGYPLMSPFIRYLNPQWGLRAPNGLPKAIDFIVELVHHECDNPVCHEVSFTYGAGFPALWRHENLNDETHEWLKQEFAHVPVTFFRQIEQCIRAGHLIAVEGERLLPADFVARAPETDARIAFFAGEKNRCFLPESQVRSFQFVDRTRPNYHSLHVLPGYSHLDVFMGKNAARDIFPLFLQELENPG